MTTAAATAPRRVRHRSKVRSTLGRLLLVRHWPLTWPGLALLLLASAVLAYGRARTDIVLTLAGLFWFALAITSGILASLASLRLHLDLRRAADGRRGQLRTCEGLPTPTGLAVPRRRLPLAAAPEIRWLAPGGTVDLAGEDGRWREAATPATRGFAQRIVREYEQQDLLGLWRIRGQVAETRPIQVIPDLGRLTAGDLAACLSSGDLLSWPFGPARGDLIDARPYSHSDPARLILWKVFARSRELLVRAPEQARSPDRHPLVYLACDEDDDAAAGIVRLLVETGLLGGGARFATDGSPRPTGDPDAALAAVCESAQHRDRAGRDLPAALGDPTVDAGDPVVVVVPATAGAWQRHVLPLAGRSPDRFVVLAAGDSAPPRRLARRWERWLFRPAGSARPTWDAMRAALHPAVASGARVVLADRVSGRIGVLAGGAVDAGRAVQAG